MERDLIIALPRLFRESVEEQAQAADQVVEDGDGQQQSKDLKGHLTPNSSLNGALHRIGPNRHINLKNQLH